MRGGGDERGKRVWGLGCEGVVVRGGWGERGGGERGIIWIWIIWRSYGCQSYGYKYMVVTHMDMGYE